MKSFCAALFYLLVVDEIWGHSIQPRLIGSDIDDTNDKLKNTIAFINQESKIICTGSFVHSSWIITSAVCAKKINLNSRYLLSGKLTDKYETASVLYDIKAHEQFNSATMVNDIGLVQVAIPVVTQVNLIPKVAKVLTDLYLTARGLGLNDFNGAPATKLREETVQIRDNKLYCAKYGVMPANTICSRHSIACLGDAGGPLLEDGNIWGVISTNDDTAEMCQKSVSQPNPRTVYTLLIPHRAWIQKTTGINL